MASFNRVILIGNLTANPQLKYLQSGLAVTEFRLAVNTTYTSKDQSKKEEVGYFDVAVFGRLAEICANYLTKGRPALVEGRLKFDSWEKDGVKRSKISIVGEKVQFLGAKGAGGPAQAEEPGDVVDDLPLEEDIPF